MIYLDYAATTPLDPKVLEVMLPYLKEKFENPSANFYKEARERRNDIESARNNVAHILNCRPSEIIFTGSGTESCNLAILGYVRRNKSDKKNHIITTKIEHHAVLYAFEALEKEGIEVTYLEPDEFGIIHPETLKKAIRHETFFVSIIYAHNEIGTIQNLKELSKISKKNDIIFHTDACQAGNYLDLDVENIGIDMMTLNGSKIYGPKGIGILFKKEKIDLEPLMYGGGQEFGIRPGTENIANIIGFAKALELVQKSKLDESKRLITLRDYLIENLLKIPDSKLNGNIENRIPNNINISFKNVLREELLLKLDEQNICCASGAACAASTSEPPYVIQALGVEKSYAKGTLRISLGKQTTKKELETVIKILPKIIKEGREFSL